MDYSAVSQAAKRFEQKSEANNEIEEYMQKVLIALKEIWMSNVENWPLYFFEESAASSSRNYFYKKKDFINLLSY